MIGKHYNIDKYHCAHFLAEWYLTKLGIEVPVTDAFDLSFLRWMRKHFTQVDWPIENCLVKMNKAGTIHVGVYADYGVYHNYKSGTKLGSVVHWELGVIKRNYEKVTYWIWSE